MSSSHRPLSPHLQIYRLPLLAVMSITHRIAGVALAIGLLLLAWWLGALAAGPGAYGAVQAVLGSLIGRVVMLGFTGALFYHLFNGLRHLLWDIGWGFEIPQAYNSGRTVIAVAALATVVTWLAAL